MPVLLSPSTVDRAATSCCASSNARSAAARRALRTAATMGTPCGACTCSTCTDLQKSAKCQRRIRKLLQLPNAPAFLAAVRVAAAAICVIQISSKCSIHFREAAFPGKINFTVFSSCQLLRFQSAICRPTIAWYTQTRN